MTDKIRDLGGAITAILNDAQKGFEVTVFCLPNSPLGTELAKQLRGLDPAYQENVTVVLYTKSAKDLSELRRFVTDSRLKPDNVRYESGRIFANNVETVDVFSRFQICGRVAVSGTGHRDYFQGFATSSAQVAAASSQILKRCSLPIPTDEPRRVSLRQQMFAWAASVFRQP